MSAVSMFFYLRIVVAMYLWEGKAAEVTTSRSLNVVAGICLAVTLLFGLYPPPLLKQVESSSRSVAARVVTNVQR